MSNFLFEIFKIIKYEHYVGFLSNIPFYFVK